VLQREITIVRLVSLIAFCVLFFHCAYILQKKYFQVSNVVSLFSEKTGLVQERRRRKEGKRIGRGSRGLNSLMQDLFYICTFYYDFVGEVTDSD